jgi:hypothetical protein
LKARESEERKSKEKRKSEEKKGRTREELGFPSI